jgi:hypothetical protein
MTLAAQVRSTMVAPEYGHPAVRETAGGTGPCRVCLQRFRVGEEERLLFTYRPRGGEGTLGAPGPVFIHASECPQYRAATFPPDLYSLPIVLEAWATGNRIPQARQVSGDQADTALAELFADPDVAFVHVRHGEAGCHIARVSRGPLPAQDPLSNGPPNLDAVADHDHHEVFAHFDATGISGARTW